MTTLPTLFLAHGSPTNALPGSPYGSVLQAIGQALPRPRAIVMVSAHWRTRGVQIQASARPPTIHDFGGFGPELEAMQYPAPGSPELADELRELLADFNATLTEEWGLDHGAWSVLTHLYPKADVPVVQLGIARRLQNHEHYAVASKLQSLRDRGVLIVGSGNITHNLGELDWEGRGGVMDWAREFDAHIDTALQHRDLPVLLGFAGIDPALKRRALPTDEHYIPLIYALGASREGELVSYPHVEMQMGSLSMRCVRFGS